jgi:hypothetical protein
VTGVPHVAGSRSLDWSAVERIERHDLVNAVALAAVLMTLALLLIIGARALFRTVDGGIIESSRPPTTATTAPAETSGDGAAGGGTEGEAEAATTTSTTLAPLREPGEVTIRVGNGAQRSGIAAAGGSRLSSLGYNVVDLKNAPPAPTSAVYHAEGYEQEGRAVARALAIPETAVGPVPANPPLDASGVALLVILGADTTVG